MVLTDIELFCAELSTNLGGEITYTDAILDSDAFEGLHFYDLFLNNIKVRNYMASRETLHRVIHDTSRDDRGVMYYMSLEGYSSLISENIKTGYYLTR